MAETREPKRLQRRRTKGWKRPENCVIATRWSLRPMPQVVGSGAKPGGIVAEQAKSPVAVYAERSTLKAGRMVVIPAQPQLRPATDATRIGQVGRGQLGSSRPLPFSRSLPCWGVATPPSAAAPADQLCVRSTCGTGARSQLRVDAGYPVRPALARCRTRFPLQAPDFVETGLAVSARFPRAVTAGLSTYAGWEFHAVRVRHFISPSGQSLRGKRRLS